jgi:hypothetical protein
LSLRELDVLPCLGRGSASREIAEGPAVIEGTGEDL